MRIGEPLAAPELELIEAGCEVQVLPSLYHQGEMHSDFVYPHLRAWLGKVGRQQ